MTERQWIEVFSIVGTAASLAVLLLVLRHRNRARRIEQKIDTLRAAGAVVVTGEAKEEILDAIEGTRRHIASNHDEIDAELRELNGKPPKVEP